MHRNWQFFRLGGCNFSNTIVEEVEVKEIDIELEEVDEDNTAVETNKEDKDKDNVNNKEDSTLLSDNLTFQPTKFNLFSNFSNFPFPPDRRL